MSRCEFRWINDRTLKISGTIDENFSIDEELPKFKEEVWIDLRDVARINSCGVREWIKAIVKNQSKIHYINCSSVIVTQFSMIPEFIGRHGVVDSFETQFVCPSCGHEDSMILVVGKDIQPGLESYMESPEMKCSECGEQMECDHNPELYFSFLSEVA
jgi:transcription elongation factor Elf1